MYDGVVRSIVHLSLVLGSVSVVAQRGLPIRTPKDDFSRSFLYVYKDASSNFTKVKGKEIKLDDQVHFACRKSIPGCKSAIITSGLQTYCTFDYGTFTSIEDAQSTMLNLSAKITGAFMQRAMVRYIDSSEDRSLLKRTAISQIVDNGFYGYNVSVDIFKRPQLPGEYCLRLVIYGGQGTFYQLIRRGEPIRSPYFKTAFARMQTQFENNNKYNCIEQLPGFTCSLVDSGGNQQLQMLKSIVDLADANMEIECLVAGVRALLGENYLYYFTPSKDDIVKKAVFVRYIDHDLYQRRSITTSLEKTDQGGYALKVLMYHP